MITGTPWRLPSFEPDPDVTGDESHRDEAGAGTEPSEEVEQDPEALRREREAAEAAEREALRAEARAAGHAEGLATGLAEGRRIATEQVRAEEAALADALRAALGRIDAIRNEFDESLSQWLHAAVVELAERVVGATLVTPAWLATSISALVERIREDLEPVRVALHPDDLHRLYGASLPDAVRLHADPDMPPGSIRAETPDHILVRDAPADWVAMREASGVASSGGLA